MKCKIQWCDCKEQSTAHDKEAVAFAVLTTENGSRQIPICAEHIQTLVKRTLHHDRACTHASVHADAWTIVTLE